MRRSLARHHAEPTAIDIHIDKMSLSRLLRFHDASVEQAFWEWRPVQRALFSLDASVALVSVAYSAYTVHGIIHGGSHMGGFEAGFAGATAGGGAQHLAALLMLLLQPDAYAQHRWPTMLARRLIHITSACYAVRSMHCSANASSAYSISDSNTLLSGPTDPPGGYVALARLATAPGGAAWSVYHVLFFPLPFAWSVALQALYLPVALYSAACLLQGAYLQPPTLSAACGAVGALRSMGSTLSVASWFDSGTTLGGAACSAADAWLFALLEVLVFGFFTPLFIAYLIESRAKWAFVKLLTAGPAQPRPGQAVAASRLADAANCTLFYVSLLLAIVTVIASALW